MSSDIKIKVQSFGRFLSNMVMPNIGAFIAWGIITALFIPTGWLPNETLAKLVGPMITYLLPLLIGYTGGKLVGGERGGVVGAITTMGAGVLRKKVQDAGLSNISVTNSAINNLPPDVDLVITHRDLTERAMRQVPQAQHISLTNFLDSGLYTSLTERLVAAQRHIDNEVKVTDSLKDSFDDTNNNLFQLGADNIFLGRKAATKEEAIRFAGEQLVKGGYVEPEYVQAMLDREKLTSTYLGESIAVPHGTIEAKDRVLKTGVVFCQYPEGVRFGEEEDEVARLVIGIAARNNEHIQVITSLTNALDDETVIERLAKTTSVDEVLALLNK